MQLLLQAVEVQSKIPMSGTVGLNEK